MQYLLNHSGAIMRLTEIEIGTISLVYAAQYYLSKTFRPPRFGEPGRIRH